MSFRSEA